MSGRTMTEEEYRALADSIRIAVSMTLDANVSMRAVVEGDGRVDLGPFVQGALAGLVDFTMDATALILRAMLADREVFSTAGDMIVLLLLATAGAFVSYAALCGGAAWDAHAELKRRRREAERMASTAVAGGAMSPNEAREVINLSDHRREP